MSKELEALERIETTFEGNKDNKNNYYLRFTCSSIPYYQDFDLVKSALERIEEKERIIHKYELLAKRGEKILQEDKPNNVLKYVDELYKERAYAYDDKIMSKGKDWNEAINHYDNIGKNLDIIKQALLKAQEQEKEIDRLENQCLDILADNIKLKKVLKVIFEKNVNFEVFGAFETYKDYEIYYNKRFHLIENKLTQEEFDLLKRYYDEKKSRIH